MRPSLINRYIVFNIPHFDQRSKPARLYDQLFVDQTTIIRKQFQG